MKRHRNRTAAHRAGASLSALLGCALGLLGAGCSKQTSREPTPATQPDRNAAVATKPSAARSSVSAPPSSAATGITSASADVYATSQGELRIVPIHHGSFRLELGTLQVYVDPYKRELFAQAPKADLILVTDIHQDHYDAAAISAVQTPATQLVVPAVVAEKAAEAEILKNGETRAVGGISLLAVPMYNLQRGPKPGAVFHEKGRGNGYVLTWGGKRIYIAGDTECTQEMRALQAIDIAFVPMNLPYTMPPEEAAECVKAFRPKVVYPYHYRGSDLGVFKQALATTPEIDVRLREWYPSGS